MKGLDKLTAIRLAEVLTQKGVVDTDIITDALYTHDKLKEPFPDILVSSGAITEWDLAKVVVEHFQLPFIMASNYEVSENMRDALPKETVFRNVLVPMDKFGNVLTVIMPILTPHEVLVKIQKEQSIILFPYVGLTSENRQVISEMHREFGEWHKRETRAMEERRKQRAKRKDSGDDWMNLFDSADAAVRDSLGGRKKR